MSPWPHHLPPTKAGIPTQFTCLPCDVCAIAHSRRLCFASTGGDVRHECWSLLHRHAPGIGMLSTRPLEVWALRGWMLTVTAVTQRLRHRWRALDTARRRRSESWFLQVIHGQGIIISTRHATCSMGMWGVCPSSSRTPFIERRSCMPRTARGRRGRSLRGGRHTLHLIGICGVV